ncbi:hypothetical protein FGRMN_9516 [Fusarium graminum]|nr:hypothetical protein FGRMN_9516 [Fusarium graminum]
MTKPARPESVPLRRNILKEFTKYLEHANSNEISVTEIGPFWTPTHGETRSTSKFTFHIGIRYANGDFSTCVLISTRQYMNVPVEGTFVNWGPKMPKMPAVMMHYKKLFNVQDLSGHSTRPGDDENDKDDGPGAGSSGWTKEVRKDDYGGYFYIDEAGEYHACEKDGNDVKSTDSRSGYQASNPRGIVLIFGDSQSQTYYRSCGQPKPCTLIKNRLRGRYFFIDEQGRERHAQYIGQTPRWMLSRQTARPSAQSSVRTPIQLTPSAANLSHTSTSKYPAVSTYGVSKPHNTAISSSGSATSYESRLHTSSVEYHTDPRSGRQYYISNDGRSHWA